jgi:hypothetical protein
VAEGLGLAVVLTGIVQVPYITVAQIADKPGPRDQVARNLTRTFSEAIANSKPSYERKRGRFAGQVVIFTTGTIVLGFLLALLATEPAWVESSVTLGPAHHAGHRD